MKQEWIARQIRMETVVGTFVLLVLIGLGYFTIVLSRDTWFTPKQNIEVLFGDVQGLRRGDSVMIRGMTVGKVESMALSKDGVRVKLAMDQLPTLREGYRAAIVPTSILGGLYLELEEGPEHAAPIDLDQPLRGEIPKDLIGDAADMMHALKQGVTDGAIISNLAVMVENARLISDRLEAGEGTLGRLLAADDQMYEDLAASLASLRTITSRIEAGEGTVGRLMGPDDTLYEDLAAATKSLRTVGERLEKGEGVLGKLISDEALGRQVEEAITEIRATIDDFRETSPILTFTSIFFGAL